ncbi:hypothetical protein [Pelomonas sp. KK5]|nr:hypothetical protein [Pelomonas sp. KK5]
MNLISQLSRSVHQLQGCLHLAQSSSASPGVVITVALLSVAAASVLVLAP